MDMSPSESRIDADTRLTGILGHPVRHTLSPIIHNTAFRAQGINCCYVALDVPSSRLPEAVRGLASLGFLGANVTIPHKQAVLSLLDGLSDEVQAVGAANTIVCRNGQLFGYNTDVSGFLTPLEGKPLAGKRMTILGAGGAARAAAYGLLKAFAPSRICLAARRVSQAEALARDLAPYDFSGALVPVQIDRARDHVRTSDLIVNATPVGMHPQVASSPWPHVDDFSPGQLVYDMVYRPRDTRLLRQARGHGAETLEGVSMLINQAAAAFVQWTGMPMPMGPVEAALAEALQ